MTKGRVRRVNPNWDVEKVMETLDEPIHGEHGEITERVGEVVYTAKTPLPDGYRDAFTLSLRALRRGRSCY